MKESVLRFNRNSTPKPAEKLGAVCYFRVSTKEQLQNYSISTQQDKCREYCKANGLTILAEFQEPKSAKNAEQRPEFQKMLGFCRDNRDRVGYVVVIKTDRFARNTADDAAVRAILQSFGIRLYSVSEGFDDSPTGKAMASIAAVFAELDNTQRAERTVAGMKTSQLAGNHTHRAPVGYLNADAPGNMILDPSKAPFIKQAFELYAEGYTKAEVLPKLTDAGFRMTSGKAATAQALDHILRNARYAGWVVSSWGFEAKGKFPAIVSEELFERVHERLHGGSKERQVRSLHSEDFPLRVFLRCAGCDKPLTGSFSTGRGGKRYAHYSCRVKGCRATKAKRDELHRRFIEFLYLLRLKGENTRLFHAVVKDVWRQKHAQRIAAEAQAGKTRKALEEKKQRALNLYVDGKISDDDYQKQASAVGTALNQLGPQLTAGEISDDELERLLEFADWMLERVAGIWNAASLPNKLRLQTALFPKGLKVSKEGFGTAKVPYFLSTSGQGVGTKGEMASPMGFEPMLSP